MLSSKTKKIIIFVIAIVVVLLILGGYKALKIRKQIAAFENMAPPPATISTSKATSVEYQPTTSAVGTFKALNGVNITPEVAGQVVKINFKSGQWVNKGQPLVLLDDRAAKADLLKAKATYQNAHITMLRDQRLIKVHAIGQSSYDADLTLYRQALAGMQSATVALEDHTISAPFTGKLGIKKINIGEYITPGQAIVALQTQNPIHLDFNLPEKDLASLKVGTRVDAKVDRYPNITFHGSLTAMNSTIDPDSRTIEVQATFGNAHHALFPGGFATATVFMGAGHKVIAIPNTAVTYRLYGDSVYVVTSTPAKGKAPAGHEATLKYITVGNPVNADMVTVSKGLKLGDSIVTSGQNKLQVKNPVLINNKVPKTDNFVKEALK